MFFLYGVTVLALIVSFIINRRKTVQALKIAIKKFVFILPAFIIMLVLVSVVLFLIPETVITKYLGSGNKLFGVISASLFGSIALMPGFIAFPLCGVLLQKGVPFFILSAFSTTLMMVGIVTYPIEREYFGRTVTIIRNVLSFFIAFTVAFITGIIFGEIF